MNYQSLYTRYMEVMDNPDATRKQAMDLVLDLQQLLDANQNNIQDSSCLIGCIVIQDLRVKVNGMINRGVFGR